LRVVSRNEELKILVIAFFRMIPVLLSLIYVSGIMMWILSIFMINNWAGHFFFCSLPSKLYDNIITKDDCLLAGGSWQN